MNVQMENVVPDGFVFEREQNVMHGACNGIALLIIPVMAEDQFRIQLHADVERSGGKERLLEYLGMLQQRHSFVQYAGYNGMNMVSVHVASREQEDKENLTIVISEFTSKCAEFGLHNCCTHCKNVSLLRAATVDGAPALLCAGCLSQMTGGAKKKENVLLGLIGAVFGVLLGTILWIVIGQAGFIAGIAGYAIVFCGMKGYELLGKSLSKAGIIICVLLSCLMIAGAEFVSLGIVIFRELGDMYGLTLGDSFALVPAFLQESEVVGEVAKDLVIGYALAIWASYASVKSRWKQVDQEAKPHNVVSF